MAMCRFQRHMANFSVLLDSKKQLQHVTRMLQLLLFWLRLFLSVLGKIGAKGPALR